MCFRHGLVVQNAGLGGRRPDWLTGRKKRQHHMAFLPEMLARRGLHLFLAGSVARMLGEFELDAGHADHVALRKRVQIRAERLAVDRGRVFAFDML